MALWVALVGFVLLGVAKLRLAALPSSCGWTLLACPTLALLSGDYGGGAVLGLDWLLVGHTLLTQRDASTLLSNQEPVRAGEEAGPGGWPETAGRHRSTPPRSYPWRPRAFRRVVGAGEPGVRPSTTLLKAAMLSAALAILLVLLVSPAQDRALAQVQGRQPPQLDARAWALVDADTGAYLAGETRTSGCPSRSRPTSWRRSWRWRKAQTSKRG